MFKSVTYEEIVKDIFEFEGIDIDININKELLFTNLYSKYFQSPLSDDATDYDLEKRIVEFVNKNYIPANIKIPTGYRYVLFAGNGEENVDLLIATNDHYEFKDEVSIALSKDSSYTTIVTLIDNELIKKSRRLN